MSNDVPICQKKGLHSLRLLPHFTALKAHLDSLEAMPPVSFAKPADGPKMFQMSRSFRRSRNWQRPRAFLPRLQAASPRPSRLGSTRTAASNLMN